MTELHPVQGTYHSALQHDLVTPEDDALLLGVVNEPMYGLETLIDRNDPRLAPPEDLFHEFKARADELGHNEAWEETEFATRYRDYLLTDESANAAILEINLERQKRPVYVVCYENTADKRCHREILLEELREN